MSYSEEKFEKVALKGSASLQYNNLSALGGTLTYAHKTETVVLQGSSSSRVEVDKSEKDTVYQSKLVTLDGVTYLVICSGWGIQIWDATGSKKLFAWKLPSQGSSSGGAAHAPYMRGVATTIASDGSTHLCAGTSAGSLEAFSVAKGGEVKHVSSTKIHSAGITAMGSSLCARHGSRAEDVTSHVVIADMSGNIAVMGADGASYSVVARMTTPEGMPVTALVVRKGYVVAGLLDGRVVVFDMMTSKMRMCLRAASRCLTAMDIHPTRDLIATVSEDATIGIWEFPFGDGEVKMCLSTIWIHVPLTGVAFCGGDDVAVSAFDVDELRIFKA